MRPRRESESGRNQQNVHDRHASVWERGNRLFVETRVHPPRGGRVTMDQPRFFSELPKSASAETLGASVLEALAANYVDVGLDYPSDILDTVYAAGLKSYGTFTRGAKYVPVTLHDDHVRVGVMQLGSGPIRCIRTASSVPADGPTSSPT